ncbi:hypothetical protein BO94DRAFT_605664 [Aspergillus sclerotioniger CBS 115572]|uniref:Uncharacterized protein n=1 Tax=Aspergillus sclerotioniger CBS 115572 TaxID=1450535 RepID=A0A317VQV8_9EURO|nr:hypothetical protein BO94DRAFT_605664 [Aspergillus sclerotioniger CBS 115572]PWY75282.1 hypothetical protein BO94DRAFT_605664 [Aspergillus sclerotioniger CBS 115572]
MAICNTESDYYSPYLEANACFTDHAISGINLQYTGAYIVSGDVRIKGAGFLTEAERQLQSHQFKEGGEICLASLRGYLLLYKRGTLISNQTAGALTRRLVTRPRVRGRRFLRTIQHISHIHTINTGLDGSKHISVTPRDTIARFPASLAPP